MDTPRDVAGGAARPGAPGRDGDEEGMTVNGEGSASRPTWWYRLTPTEREREIDELEALLRLVQPAAEQQAA